MTARAVDDPTHLVDKHFGDPHVLKDVDRSPTAFLRRTTDIGSAAPLGNA